MPRRILHILCLTLFLVPLNGLSQALPSLEKAKGTVVETLPNGVSCYLVPGSEKKGFADFALVQKGVPDIASSRAALGGSSREGSVVPYEFVSSHGAYASRQGFVSYLPSSTRFDFPEMPVYDQAVADTTLMMLFDMASSSKGEQAIVVCGDITPAAMLERIKMFSILLSSREKSPEEDPYVWEQKDSLDLRFLGTGSEDVASVNFTFSSSRTDRENMNTPLPLLTRLYSSELSIILEGRLCKAFRAADIPLIGVECRRTDSSSGPWEEKSKLSVRLPVRDLEKGMQTIAGVLSSLDTDGATQAEFTYAREASLSRLAGRLSHGFSNSENVDRCVAAYLYGSDLASPETVLATVSRKSLSEERELELFNGFVSALLDSSRNLFIRCDVPGSIDTGHLKDVFEAGWARKDGSRCAGDAPLLQSVDARSRMKVKSDAVEPISGGRLWTFSNGMTVIFRKTSDPSAFRYAMMLRGGYTEVPSLKRGEGIFVGDVLRLSKVAGCAWEDFESALAAEGVELKTAVSPTDLRITGKAPSAKLGLVFSALNAVCAQREPDEAAFAAFRKRESFSRSEEKLAPRNVFSLMDSLACPDDPCPERRSAAAPGADLQKRAESYFTRQFSKCSDGVIVILGNFDEETLKKDLCKYLNCFETKNLHSSRPVMDLPLVSGRRSYSAEPAEGGVGGLEIGAYLELCALADMGMQNYMSFLVARDVFRSRLAPVLAECGYSARVESEIKYFPKERMAVRVAAVPCFQDGLSSGMSAVPAAQMQERLRGFVEALPSVSVSSAELKALKADVLARMKALRDNPSELMETVLQRYSQGRDNYSGYEKALNAVSSAGVKEILSSLSSGTFIEYVIE